MIAYQVTNGIAELRLNAPPHNAITLSMLDELCSFIRKANEDDSVQGILILGGDDHFSAGADVNLFREITDREGALRLSQTFQDAFNVVGTSDKPVAAAVNGRVMGGALELAMACHVRVCAEDARFSMPEVNLGIIPGAGGTQRLPRLVGPEAALSMMLSAKPVGAQQARELGLIDAVCGKDRVLEAAHELLRSEDARKRTSDLIDKVCDRDINEAAQNRAREQAEKLRPEIIAPLEMIKAVETGLTESFQAGLARERKGFARCMETTATRNKIYVFFASRDTGKALDPKGPKGNPVANPAVVGAGTMGTGIVQALIMAGLPVTIWDKDKETSERCVARIRKSLEKRADQGKLAPLKLKKMLNLMRLASDWSDLAPADLVIEAAFEDVKVKQAILSEIESVCPAETLIASNTSTLSLETLAEEMAHPNRLVGMHFFNPAHRMPLVEIIRRETTPTSITATALRFAKTIRKTPVLVRNRTGFLVNRLFIPYLKEAFALLEDGAEARAIDEAMMKFGFAMGPLTLIDMAGIDILVLTDAVMRKSFPYHGPLSAIATRLVEDGHLGQKSGSGVYRYEKGQYSPLKSKGAQRIMSEVRQEAGREPRDVDTVEITERLVLRMAAEAFRVMEEGIVPRESDIDAAMVLGTGFPDFQGGIVRFARDAGLGTVIERLDALTRNFGERFQPCELLVNLKGA